MKLEQYRTLWGNIDIFDGLLAGSPHHDIDTLLPHLASLGYDGVEMPLKLALFLGPERLKTLLTQYDMHLTLSIYTDSTFNAGSPELDWWGGTHQGFTPPIKAIEMAAALVQRTERHEAKNAKGHYEGSYEALEEEQPVALLQILERHVTCFKEEAAACYQIFGDRREGGLLTLVVAHDLRDNFPWAIAARYFRDILAWEKEHGFVIAHETHRKRFLHSPWAIRDFFLKYPDIRAKIALCADYSHLLCVSEVDTSDPVLNQVIDFLAPNVLLLSGFTTWKAWSVGGTRFGKASSNEAANTQQ
jgi:sugar phosphate isomerase/epimerase